MLVALILCFFIEIFLFLINILQEIFFRLSMIIKVIAQRVSQGEIFDIDCGTTDNAIHMSNIEIMFMLYSY
jgi:hypothetical protein